MRQRYILHNNFTSEIDRYHKELVREVAEKFGLQKTLIQNIPAHFTLKYWFEADERQLARLESVLAQFCKYHHSAPVEFDGIKGFPQNVVFIDIRLSTKAKRNFDDLMDTLGTLPWMSWDQYDAPNLQFHSTIAEDCDSDYSAIIEFLAARHGKTFTGTFNNITITRQVALKNDLPLLEPYRVFELP